MRGERSNGPADIGRGAVGVHGQRAGQCRKAHHQRTAIGDRAGRQPQLGTRLRDDVAGRDARVVERDDKAGAGRGNR